MGLPVRVRITEPFTPSCMVVGREEIDADIHSVETGTGIDKLVSEHAKPRKITVN